MSAIDGGSSAVGVGELLSISVSANDSAGDVGSKSGRCNQYVSFTVGLDRGIVTKLISYSGDLHRDMALGLLWTSVTTDQPKLHQLMLRATPPLLHQHFVQELKILGHDEEHMAILPGGKSPWGLSELQTMFSDLWS